MGALVHRVTGSREAGAMGDTFTGPTVYPPGTGPSPAGVVIDGAVYPLASQPQAPRGGNWGDMSWLAWWRQRGMTGVREVRR
jgi:hypothetical protein